MSNKVLLPVRKGRAKKPSDAATLLHALVIALRDERPREDLIKLVSTYPRVMNRTNPFLQLIDEIGKLRDQLGFPHDQGELLREVDGQLEAWTNHRRREQQQDNNEIRQLLLKKVIDWWQKHRGVITQ